jgi:hypothetical protein
MFDLLKVLTSHPSQTYRDCKRCECLGALNEPCLKRRPRRTRSAFPFGLMGAARIVRQTGSKARRPIPGVKIGTRVTNDGSALPIGPYFASATRPSFLAFPASSSLRRLHDRREGQQMRFSKPKITQGHSITRPLKPKRCPCLKPL